VNGLFFFESFVLFITWVGGCAKVALYFNGVDSCRSVIFPSV
jgi:hypothetical protein